MGLIIQQQHQQHQQHQKQRRKAQKYKRTPRRIPRAFMNARRMAGGPTHPHLRQYTASHRNRAPQQQQQQKPFPRFQPRQRLHRHPHTPKQRSRRSRAVKWLWEGSIFDVAKVSVVGIGMRSHTGVAAKMFQVLSAEGINIKVITTSEIKISVLIDRKYVELAVQALHDAFELEKAA